MQQTNEPQTFRGVEGVLLERIATGPGGGGNRSRHIAEVAHDARNMVTALACYCDLLEEPGVLSEPYRHYGYELRMVVSASRRLIDKLLTIEGSSEPPSNATRDTQLKKRSLLPGEPAMPWRATRTHNTPAPRPVDNLALEIQKNRNLLAALVGQSITLSVDIAGGARPIRMNCEDLTRILVNLVKNAAEAMPTGGTIRLTLREVPTGPKQNACVILTVEDNGPGVPSTALGRIFEPGYTTRSFESDGYGVCRPEHHGLGLSITRSIIEGAGGWIQVANRDPAGACFQIELPSHRP